MANRIKENNDVFILQGKITSSTGDQLTTHLEHLLSLNKKLTINIDEVTEIDEKGILVLFQIHIYALRYNYCFSIVGQGCKEIYDQFNYQNIA